MSEEKESKVNTTPEVSASEATPKDIVKTAAEKIEAAAKAAAEVARAEAEVEIALAKAVAAKAVADTAAEEEYKAIAAEVKSTATKAPAFTNQRKGEEIFRREMDEPEFFLAKKDRFPRPILTSDEQDELTRKVEIPKDNTPKYIPQHVLSPEFGGMSNYESGVGKFLEETKQKLKKLKNNPDASKKDITTTQHELEYLESLYENYYIGMNVFRTAKGGRNKLGE
jgi:colicin import membrane protein